MAFIGDGNYLCSENNNNSYYYYYQTYVYWSMSRPVTALALSP